MPSGRSRKGFRDSVAASVEIHQADRHGMAEYFGPLRRGLLGLILVTVPLFVLAGCGPSRPAMAPVSGKVLYKGQPLAFGSVMFQPAGGQPARGVIQPDGTFVLWTYREGDGAAIGPHRVRVTCFEGQKAPPPGEEKKERGLGANLIPVRYNSIDTSGLTAEVKKQNEPVVLELVD